jgi:xylulokinase
VHAPGTIKTTTGTGTFVNAPIEEAPFDFFDKDLKLFCTPRATGDGALMEAVLPGTGTAYRWARDQFHTPKTPFEALDKQAARVPAASQGVQFLPLLPFSLASFQRLGLHATRGHLLRSILEASAYGSRFFIEVLQELGVKAHGPLRLDGGGARSPLWRRILADTHRRAVQWPQHVEDAAARGAAILCALGTRAHKSPERAIAAMVRFDGSLGPDPTNADLYDAEYPAWQSAFFTAAAGVEV